MFGIRILTRRSLNEIKTNAKALAMVELLELLRKKDKIFLAPVTIEDHEAYISDCVFFGTPEQPSLII